MIQSRSEKLQISLSHIFVVVVLAEKHTCTDKGVPRLPSGTEQAWCGMVKNCETVAGEITETVKNK